MTAHHTSLSVAQWYLIQAVCGRYVTYEPSTVTAHHTSLSVAQSLRSSVMEHLTGARRVMGSIRGSPMLVKC